MVERSNFTAQEAQHEGLSHSPLLTIYETSKTLARLSHDKKQDKKHQEEVVENSKHHIFSHGGEAKLITCSISDPDNLSDNLINSSRFNGFKYQNETWNLSFGEDEEILYPVDKIRTTE